jgi:hypothetical protein
MTYVRISYVAVRRPSGEIAIFVEQPLDHHTIAC